MKRIDCFYGPSGAAKSESIAALIRRLHTETGKKARVIIGDGSAATYEGLVEAGIVELADFSIRDWPLSTMKQFCEGYWPEDPLDPKSKMVPMTKERYDGLCLVAIEGIAVAGNYITGDKKGGFSERASKGEKIAGDSPVTFVDLDRKADGTFDPKSGPGMTFGGVTLGGVGHAQRRLGNFIEASKALPGWVIWTTHERAAEDKLTNVKVIGPEVIGGAMTPNLSRVFNNTLHFTTAEKKKKVTDEHTEAKVDELDVEYRIYTRDHFRPEGNTFVKYRAVTRHVDPTGKKYPLPDGKPAPALELYYTSDTPGQSIIDIYESIAEAHKREQAALRAAKPAA